MSKIKTYTLSIIGSIVSLAIGGVLLYGLVPITLTFLTYIAVAILAVVAYLIEKGYAKAVKVGAILAIISIIISASSPAHDKALLMFGSNKMITILDVLMVLGFYAFPAIYLFAFLINGIKKRNASIRY
ncbi:MAG: hypothetical protein LRS41_00535 [Caldisphaeraceae archaeon]|nr:hypothetical protein [Caldisphaeraceae archaeon]